MEGRSEGSKTRTSVGKCLFFQVFSISSRHKRLPSVSCISLVLNNFRERRNSARRTLELGRPWARIAVEPHAAHSRARRADAVVWGIVFYVQQLMGLDPGHLEHGGEYAPLWLRPTRRPRGGVAPE